MNQLLAGLKRERIKAFNKLPLYHAQYRGFMVPVKPKGDNLKSLRKAIQGIKGIFIIPRQEHGTKTFHFITARTQAGKEFLEKTVQEYKRQ